MCRKKERTLSYVCARICKRLICKSLIESYNNYIRASLVLCIKQVYSRLLKALSKWLCSKKINWFSLITRLEKLYHYIARCHYHVACDVAIHACKLFYVLLRRCRWIVCKKDISLTGSFYRFQEIKRAVQYVVFKIECPVHIKNEQFRVTKYFFLCFQAKHFYLFIYFHCAGVCRTKAQRHPPLLQAFR